MPSPSRILRQLLETDRLMGVEAAPRARFPAPEAAAPAAARPAAPRPMAPPPVRPAAIGTAQAIARSTPAPAAPAAPASAQAAWRIQSEIPLGSAQPAPGDVDALFVSVEWGPPLSGEVRALFDRQVDAMRKLGPFTAGLLRLAWPGTAEPTDAALAEAKTHILSAVAAHPPRVAVLLGGFSAKAAVGAASLTLARGRWFALGGSCAACATWHPSQLGVDRDRRMQTWEDLQKVMAKLKE